MDKRKEEMVEAILKLERDHKEAFGFRLAGILKMHTAQLSMYLADLVKDEILIKTKDKYSTFNIYSVDTGKYAQDLITQRVTRKGVPLKKGQTVDDVAASMGITRKALYFRLKSGWKFIDGIMKK